MAKCKALTESAVKGLIAGDIVEAGPCAGPINCIIILLKNYEVVIIGLYLQLICIDTRERIVGNQ